MRQKWMKCCMLLMTLVPAMTQAATTISVPTQMTTEQYTIMQDYLATQKEDLMYISPINVEAELISPFGEIREGYIHQGNDYRLPIGTPIYAIADATVIKAAPDSKGVNVGGGNIIMLNHGDGVQTWYMHLDAYAVNIGDKITKGQIIGFSGNSGESTTPHLHFEYRINNVPIDANVIVETKPLIKLNEPFLVVQS